MYRFIVYVVSIAKIKNIIPLLCFYSSYYTSFICFLISIPTRNIEYFISKFLFLEFKIFCTHSTIFAYYLSIATLTSTFIFIFMLSSNTLLLYLYNFFLVFILRLLFIRFEWRIHWKLYSVHSV